MNNEQVATLLNFAFECEDIGYEHDRFYRLQEALKEDKTDTKISCLQFLKTCCPATFKLYLALMMGLDAPLSANFKARQLQKDSKFGIAIMNVIYVAIIFSGVAIGATCLIALLFAILM